MTIRPWPRRIYLVGTDDPEIAVQAHHRRDAALAAATSVAEQWGVTTTVSRRRRNGLLDVVHVQRPTADAERRARARRAKIEQLMGVQHPLAAIADQPLAPVIPLHPKGDNDGA